MWDIILIGVGDAGLFGVWGAVLIGVGLFGVRSTDNVKSQT